MSNNSAADLLSILRGDKPAPAPPHPPPPQRTPSATSTYHTPLQSSAASMVNVGIEPNKQGSAGTAGTGGNDGLEQLFRAFGQPHPSQAAQAGQVGGGQQSSMPGALPSQQYTPQPPPPPTLRKTSSSGADTASLLSLLRGGGAGSGSGATGPTSGGAGGSAATATAPPPLPAQAPPPMSPQGGTAGELLASLMGGGEAATTVTAGGGTGAASAAQPVKSAKEEAKPREEEKKKPQPNFNFVSPFDLLDKLHAEDKAKAAASTASSAQATPQKPPLSSVPSHLLRSPRSPASTSSGGGGGGASDGEDRPRSASSTSRAPFALIEQVAALSASSPAPSSVGSSAAPRPSTSSASSAFPTHLLASQYLPSTATTTASSSSSPLRASFAPPSTFSSTSRPSYAPSGLRLPRPPPTQPQILCISLSEAHYDSLSPHAGASTPITLMDSKGDYVDRAGEGAGAKRKMGVWEGGIVYSMGKKGRVRVIERESGARGILKLNEKEKEGKKSKGAEKEKEDEVVDLRIAPAAKKDEEGRERRHVGVVSRDGRVVIWAVSERFVGEGDEEREMQSARILDIPSDPSPGVAKPSLIRFHPLYSAKPVIAIVFSGVQVGLLDVEKAQLLKGQGKTGKEVVEGAMEKVAFEGGESITDLAFSPDGSAFAFITSTSSYSVRSTASPSTVLFSGSIPLPPSGLPSFVNGGSSSGSSSTVTPAPAVLPSTTDETKPPRPCEVLFVSPRSAPSRPAALAVSFNRGTEVVVFPLSSSSPLPVGAVTSLSFPPPSSDPETEKTHYGRLAYHSETQSLVVSSSLRGSLWTFRLAFPPSTTFPSGEEGDDAAYLSALASSSATNEPKPVRIDHVLETPLLSGPVVSFVLSPSSSSSSSASSTLPLDTPELPPAAVAAAGKTPFDVLLTHLKGIDLVQVVAEKPREYGASSRSAMGGVHPSSAAAFTFGNANPFGLGETALEEALNGHNHAHDLDLHPHDHDHDHDDHLGTDEDADEFDRAMAAGRRMSLEGSIYVSSEVEVCVEEPDHWEREHAEEVAQWDGKGMNGFDHHHHHPEDRQLSVDEPALGDLGAAGLPVTPNVEFAPPHPQLPHASSTATAATPSSPSRSPSSSLHPPAPTPPKSPKRAAAVGTGGAPLHQQHQEAEVIRELRRIEQGFRGEIGKIVRGELEKHVHHLEEDRLQALETTTAREETLLKLALQAVKKDTTKLVESAVREQVQKHVGTVVKEAVRGEVVRGVEGSVRQVLPAELDKQLSRPDIAFPLSASIATTIAPPLERSLTNALMSAVVPAFERNLSSAVDGLVTSIRQEMLDVRKEIVQEQSGAVAVLEDEVSGLKSEVAGLRAQMEQMLELLVASRLAPPEGSPRMGHHPQLQEHHPHQQQQAQAQRHAPPSAVLSPSAAVVATGANALPTAPHHHGLPASISSTSLASITSAVAAGQPLPPIPRSHTPPERYEELFTETMQPHHEPEFTALVHLINSSPAGRIDAVFPPVGGPRVSMAVVLSLAFRLSQVLASRDGKMDEEGRRMLGWLRRAVTACDGKQPPEFHTMIPRILTTVLEHLVARGRRLAMIGDSAGANEIKVIEQYARARLSLFSQGGGEGPEGFRR